MYSVPSSKYSVNVFTKKAKLPIRHQELLGIFPVLNNTFLSIGKRGLSENCFTHFDKEGKFIDSVVLKDYLDYYIMLNDRELLFFQARKDCISVWNLETHKIRKIKFHFLNNNIQERFFSNFPDTKCFCIVEVDSEQNNTLFKLSYFKYEDIQKNATEEIEPFHVFESYKVWNEEYMVCKGNDHSMICWFEERQDDEFQIRTYDLREEGKNYNCYKCPNNLASVYEMEFMQITVNILFQTNPYEFLLVCNSNRALTMNGPPNNNYILNVKTKEIREAKFNLGRYQQNIFLYVMGDFSIFHAIDAGNRQTVETPVYFIENKTEEIIAEERWRKRKRIINRMGKNSFISGLYEGNMKEITVVKRQFAKNPIHRWFPRSIIYTHFLEQTFEKIDFDLVYEISQIIEE